MAAALRSAQRLHVHAAICNTRFESLSTSTGRRRCKHSIEADSPAAEIKAEHGGKTERLPTPSALAPLAPPSHCVCLGCKKRGAFVVGYCRGTPERRGCVSAREGRRRATAAGRQTCCIADRSAANAPIARREWSTWGTPSERAVSAKLFAHRHENESETSGFCHALEPKHRRRSA